MKKEALIFGANGALGKGITETFLKKNYNKVYLFDFNMRSVEIDAPNAVLINIENLAEENNVKKAFENIEASKEKLLFLYSTIGGYSGGKNFWELEADDFDTMMSMNLKSSFLIAKHFASKVKESAGGSICFTAAYAGVAAEAGKSLYSASKAGLNHLVKTISLEGKEINLSVNALAPYIIDTPANREWLPKSDYNHIMKPHEMGELAHSIFNSFNFVTGNIINLTYRFEIN
jgi:NAD(P)-dependent dehydrogenase (short-subunit alcohol dehydrogenase family)